MENDSVRSSGDMTLVDMWIDGKLRAISVSRDAIHGFLHLSPDRADAMSDDDRREFVRTHLGLVVKAATSRLRDTDATAEAVTIDAGGLGGQAPRPVSAREGDRRKGDRRKMNLGPPPATGERRK